MAQEFQPGDRVQWGSGSGTAVGEVQKRVTQPIDVEGHRVEASADDPRYLVKNEHTGTVTGHKAETLQPAEAKEARSSSSSNHSSEGDRDGILHEFNEAVNMTAKQLQDWLSTDESQSVGQEAGDGEAIGHKSGKRIIDLLQKHKADYTDSDYSHMQKVVSYVHRHSAQKPSGNVENTRWRYSLMNWGHDPLKS